VQYHTDTNSGRTASLVWQNRKHQLGSLPAVPFFQPWGPVGKRVLPAPLTCCKALMWQRIPGSPRWPVALCWEEKVASLWEIVSVKQPLCRRRYENYQAWPLPLKWESSSPRGKPGSALVFMRSELGSIPGHATKKEKRTPRELVAWPNIFLSNSIIVEALSKSKYKTALNFLFSQSFLSSHEFSQSFSVSIKLLSQNFQEHLMWTLCRNISVLPC